MIRSNEAPEAVIEFKPVGPDSFHAGQSFILFKRDKAGRVVGLEYTNPLLRKVKFVRRDQS
jgi:hypothetical protein